MELEQKAAWGQMGMNDPFAPHVLRPLTDHLDDFEKYLEGRDNCKKHVGQTRRYIEHVLTETGCHSTANVAAQQISDWLARHRKAGRSARTVNSYLNALQTFFRWMVKVRRMPDNPLSHLSGFNAKADVRRQRRSIEDEQTLTRWMEATLRGKPFRDLTGEDRAVLYSVAIYTGLRARKLASLTRGSFDLDSEPPTVTVAAAYSKRCRKDVLPLHPELADDLKAWLAGRPYDEPVWPGTWHERSASTLRKDLVMAGIPYEDASGRFFDFHALRGQFISSLARSGVHPRTAQLLARHSDINLTMYAYTNLGLIDLQAAIHKLPSPRRKTESGKTGEADTPGEKATET